MIIFSKEGFLEAVEFFYFELWTDPNRTTVELFTSRLVLDEKW